VQRISLERKFRAEQAKLEAKYEVLYKPLYDERAKIVNGQLKVKSEDVKNILTDVKPQMDVDTDTGVADYWLTALSHTSQFGERISAKDEKILKHLTDISIDYLENGNFTISFHFSMNEFMNNTVLKREFVLDEKQNIKKINSTKVEWANEEANPTIAKKKKKVKGKGKGEVKTIIKTEACESFFNFFKDFENKGLDSTVKVDKEKDEENEEEEKDEDNYIEEEYDLGVFIKDELIPYSLEYYLDIVDEESEDGGEDEMEEDAEEEVEEKKPGKKKLF